MDFLTVRVHRLFLGTDRLIQPQLMDFLTFRVHRLFLGTDHLFQPQLIAQHELLLS